MFHGRRWEGTRKQFLAAAVCLVIGVVGMVAAGSRLEHDDAWVAHSREVGDCIEDMAMNLWAAQRDHGELKTSDAVTADYTKARQLTRDNEPQQRRFDRLVVLLQSPGADTHAVWQLLNEIRSEEQRLENARLRKARRSLEVAYVGTAAVLGAAALMLVLFWRRLSEELARQMTAMRLLRESDAKTAMLLENTKDIVWAVDRELRVTASNHRFRRLPEKATQGEPSLADFAAWREQYDAVLAGKKITVDVGQYAASGRERCYMVSFTPILVDAQVTGVAVFAKDITTRKRTELKLAQRAETLHYLAVYDQLTQLHNRRGFLELGGALVREARGNSQSVSVMFVDLDGLKAINDTLGHGAGDAAICSAADCLTDSLRRTDVVGRLGGDEFVVVAAGVDDDDVLIERIQKNAAARSLSMSIGVVREEPGDEEQQTLEQLIERADSRMYEEKVSRKRGKLAAV
jgi:diguanylate cyclase (GGDEF)-like protein